MKLPFLAAPILALSLCGGCTTFGTIASGGSVAQANPASMTEARRALAVAHQTYNALGQEIVTVAVAGILKGPTASQVKKYYDIAGDALTVADAAEKAANSQGVMNALVSVSSAMSSAKMLAGVK